MKTPKAVKLFFGAMLLTAVFVGEPRADELIKGLRIGDHGTKTRIVIDLDGPTEFHLNPGPDGLSLEVLLPQAADSPTKYVPQRGMGLIARYTFREGDTGGTVIRFVLKAPGAVKQVIKMRPRDTKGDRLVIDLVAEGVPTDTLPTAARAPAKQIVDTDKAAQAPAQKPRAPEIKEPVTQTVGKPAKDATEPPEVVTPAPEPRVSTAEVAPMKVPPEPATPKAAIPEIKEPVAKIVRTPAKETAEPSDAVPPAPKPAVSATEVAVVKVVSETAKSQPAIPEIKEPVAKIVKKSAADVAEPSQTAPPAPEPAKKVATLTAKPDPAAVEPKTPMLQLKPAPKDETAKILEQARAAERAKVRSQQVRSQRLAELISSAEKGDPVAKYWLGARYLKGDGIPKNLDKAVTQFQSAAKLGYAPAQVQMGLLYRNGVGVVESMTESMDWFFRASLSGNRVAQFNLGQIYRLGNGVPKDVGKAAQWYRMAAMRQYPLAQFALGLMHLEGMGVPRDPDRARMWIKAAADQGLPEAKVVLRKLSRR